MIRIPTTAQLLPFGGSLAGLRSSLKILCFAFFLLAGTSFWFPTHGMFLGCQDVICFLNQSWSQGAGNPGDGGFRTSQGGLWEGLPALHRELDSAHICPALSSALLTEISPNELCCLNWGKKRSPLISTKTAGGEPGVRAVVLCDINSSN